MELKRVDVMRGPDQGEGGEGVFLHVFRIATQT